MEQKKQMLSKIESLSEQEKLELFNVEELETRLEMQIVKGFGPIGKGPLMNDTTNNGCWN
ncbi:MAG: hypothetical protein ABI288_08600 [Ginsengibacter sp.]